MTVYGGEYSDAALLLVAITVYLVLGTQTVVLLQSLNGIDMPEATFKLSTVAFVINILLGVFLVSGVGAVGVIVSTVVAELLRYVGAGDILSKNIEGLSLLSTPMAHQLFAGVVMFAVVEAAATTLDISSWVELLAVSLGAAVYSVLLLTISDALRATIIGVFEGSQYGSIVRRLVRLFEFESS